MRKVFRQESLTHEITSRSWNLIFHLLLVLSPAFTPFNIEQLEPDHNGMVNYVEYINMVCFNVCYYCTYIRTPVSSPCSLHTKTHEKTTRKCAVSAKNCPHTFQEANNSRNILVLLTTCTLEQMMND